ncbi:MAG: PIG-L family deacetylase [Arthrospira platensis PCC 7345]|uniref:PIG-L family deacetylase n=1 Tax=Limnospira platensis TaxID=118562 RepID=UPI0028E167B6|nr:PIG-L family deacetylase [Arthrospira platensis PCC 7345]
MLLISPHIDDAFLSLQSFIVDSSVRNQIVNVFSFSNFSLSNISLPNEVSLLRKKEEMKIASYFGNVDVLFLDLPDCLLRGYTTPWISDTKQILSKEKFLIDKLYHLIFNIKYDGLMLFPLSVANHVDHIICQIVGNKFLDKGFEVGFYLEIPYKFKVNFNVFPKPFMNTQKTLLFSEKEIVRKSYSSQFNPSNILGFYGETITQMVDLGHDPTISEEIYYFDTNFWVDSCWKKGVNRGQIFI